MIAILVVAALALTTAQKPTTYKATLRLDQLLLVSSDGRTQRTSLPITLSGTVGWLAG